MGRLDALANGLPSIKFQARRLVSGLRPGAAGLAITAAGAAALLHSRLPHGVIRGAQIAAAVSEVWMILAGAGIYIVGRRRGGDWAGYTLLGGMAFVAAGMLLLLLTLAGLQYLRRLRAGQKDIFSLDKPSQVC